MSDEQETRYLTRTFRLGHRDLAQKLRKRAAQVWNDTRDEFYRDKSEEVSEKEMKKRICNGNSDRYQMSAKSTQLVVKQFYSNFWAWWGKEQSDLEHENNNPPHKDKKYFSVYWTYQEITVKDGHIVLSNGNHEENLCLEWEWATRFDIQEAKLCYDESEDEFEVHIGMDVPVVDEIEGSKVAAVDPGEVHPMCVYDGEQVYLFNGGELRSKFRYLEKEHARLQEEMSRKEKGSNRWKELKAEHKELVGKIRKQVRDILHKYSMWLVDTLLREGVSTLVLGDVSGIRQGLDYGSYVNQKVHSWCFRRLYFMLRYKAELRGMHVEEVPEHDTSTVCPKCRAENSTSNRNYSCTECGFEYHRDGVGAVNIWYRYHDLNNKKYPDYGQVVGGLVPPRSIRYDPEMTCVSPSGQRTSEILRQSAPRSNKAA